MSAETATALRILIGLEGLALGGCPINALDLARTVRARGHEVSVFAVDEDVKVSLLPYAEQAGFAVQILPAEAGLLARSRQIGDLARRHHADVVHVYAPWLGPPASIGVSRRSECAVVVTNWTMANDVRTASHAPLIVGTKDLQIEASAYQRSPVSLIEPPVDLDRDHPDAVEAKAFRAQYGIAEDELCAVIVSRLDQVMKAEGIGYALRAVEDLDDPGLRLVVVGDGDAFEMLNAQAEQINASLGRPAVVMTGSLIDPHPAYAAADFMLGMGGSALRSLAHAQPLIVLGEQGFARVFEPQSTGYFYDAGFFGHGCAGDPVEHLRRVMSTLTDPDRRGRLGEFGLAQVRERFSLAAAADQLETVYRQAVLNLPPRRVRTGEAARLLAHQGARLSRGWLRKLGRRQARRDGRTG